MKAGTDIINFFAPIHLVKGLDKKGRSKMRLAGIASTSSQDADGEFLDPSGFELDYFLKYGFMNWNHQTSKDPLALIGKPTSAVTKAEGLYIDCELFENSARAKEVYELAEILEAQGGQLGFSIEGKVIERDAKNPKIVKKAKITGCAITPNPKNTDAVAEIIKGHSFGTLSAYDEEDEETKEKAMSAGSSSGQAVSKESLDKRVKVLTYGDHNDTKKFTKGEVMAQVFENNPELSLEEGENLYTLISQIEKSIIMSKTDVTISPEAIEKAYKTLGLVKGEESSEKASSEATTEDEENELEKSYKEMSKMMGGMDYKKMSKEDKSSMKKMMQDTLKKMEEGEEDDDNDDDSGDGDDDGDDAEKGKHVKKGITTEGVAAAMTILKAAGLNVVIEDTTIEKGEKDDLAPKTDAVAELIKSELGRISEESDAKFEAATTLIKSMSDELSELREEIDEIGSRSPGAKSVTGASAIEKSWNNDLEKGLGEGNDDMPVLSISKNKREILDKLEKSYFNADDELVNPQLSKAAMVFESAGQMSKDIVEEMKKQGYRLVG